MTAMAPPRPRAVSVVPSIGSTAMSVSIGVPSPIALAVEQHRRLVLLALADDDDAVHRHGVEHDPHGVDRGPVGPVLVAPAHPAAGRQRGGLGGADELEGEVAVGALLGHGSGGYKTGPRWPGGAGPLAVGCWAMGLVSKQRVKRTTSDELGRSASPGSGTSTTPGARASLIDLDDWGTAARAALDERLHLLEAPHALGRRPCVVVPEPTWRGSSASSSRSRTSGSWPSTRGREQIAYDLAEWDDQDRGTSSAGLRRRPIAFGIDDDELVVHEIDEGAVDEPSTPSSSPTRDRAAARSTGGEARTEIMGELFVAADRLVHDPDDGDGRRPIADGAPPRPPPTPRRTGWTGPGGRARRPPATPFAPTARGGTPPSRGRRGRRRPPPPSATTCGPTCRRRARIPCRRDPGRAGGLPLPADRAHPAGGPRPHEPPGGPRARASAGSSSAASWPPTSTSSTRSCSTTCTGSRSSSRPAGASPSPACATASRPTASGSPAASTASSATGEDLEFDFEVKGAAAQHILAAVYAAGALPLGVRGPGRSAVVRLAMRWPGPLDQRFVAHLSGLDRGRTWSARASSDPVRWAIGVLGLDGDGAGPRPCRSGWSSSAASGSCSATPTPTTAPRPRAPPTGSPTSPRPAASCSRDERAKRANRVAAALPGTECRVLAVCIPKGAPVSPRTAKGAGGLLLFPGAGSPASHPACGPSRRPSPRSPPPRPTSPTARRGAGPPTARRSCWPPWSRRPALLAAARRRRPRPAACWAAGRWAGACARWPSPTACPPPAWSSSAIRCTRRGSRRSSASSTSPGSRCRACSCPGPRDRFGTPAEMEHHTAGDRRPRRARLDRGQGPRPQGRRRRPRGRGGQPMGGGAGTPRSSRGSSGLSSSSSRWAVSG